MVSAVAKYLRIYFVDVVNFVKKKNLGSAILILFFQNGPFICFMGFVYLYIQSVVRSCTFAINTHKSFSTRTHHRWTADTRGYYIHTTAYIWQYAHGITIVHSTVSASTWGAVPMFTVAVAGLHVVAVLDLCYFVCGKHFAVDFFIIIPVTNYFTIDNCYRMCSNSN